VTRQHEIIQTLLIASDATAISLAWLLSYYFRFSMEVLPVTYGIPAFTLYAGLLLVVVPVWIFAFRVNGLYSLRRGGQLIDEVLALVKGGSVATLVLVSATFFYRQHTFSRVVIVLFWGTALLLCSVNRLIMRRVLKALRRRGYNVKNLVVVGAGELAELVGQKIREFPGLGLRLVGFIDAGNGGPRSEQIKPEIIGKVGDLIPLIAERRVDQILLALPRDAHQTMEKVLKSLEHEMVDVKVVPDLLQFVALKTGLEDLDGIPIINLSETPLSGWYGPVKRLMDILASLVGIVIASPVMLGIAVLVKITSPGPVIFRQERMGLDGSIFTMFKFRSMRVDAEDESGAVWAVKDDPRRTRLGTFLRRTSLDELPQMFNVLKGDMSLVGPRPERPCFVEQFREQIPRYMLRHRVKCGLTGWAQVNGYRGNTSIEKRLECDIFYIENWSLSFDIKIIWMTIWKGLINKHAY
jgi:Undecaprenyl-phosphate glucose phosphotransferase